MKRMLILLIWLATAAVIGADTQVRLTGGMSSAFEGGLSPENIAAGWGDGQNALLGFAWEVILNKIGFGTEYYAKFTRNPENKWFLDFQGNALLSYHLFGVKSFLDPFGIVGLGAAGGVNISDGVHRTSDPNLAGLSLGLYPILGFGGALDLDGVVIGARIQYHPTIWAVPAAPIADYPLSRFQFGVFAGWALGAHCGD